MPKTIIFPSGATLDLPDLPDHHHRGPCECVATCAYIRVSDVAGRDEKLVSPDVQLRYIGNDAKVRNRRVVKLIFDIDESGQTFENRSVSEVLTDIKAGVYRHVTLWKWSRWGRALEQSLAWLRQVESVGGKVDSATEDFDQATATGLMGRNLMLLLADWQSQVIGETWRGVHENRRSKGLPHSGRRRFGYDYVTFEEPNPSGGPARNIKKYVKNVAEGALLAAAYKAYVNGSSLRQLTKDWNTKGITTTRGKRWTEQALGKMLDTGFGAGLIRERSCPGDKPANRLSNYDVWRAGAHEPWIDSDLWDKYKRKREAQADLPPRARAAVHAVSALLFCGECGRRLTTKYQGRNRTHQWTCLSRAAFHPDVHVGVSNAMILDHVRGWIGGRIHGGEGVEAEALRLEAARNATSDVGRLGKELERIEGRLERLLDLHLDGALSRDKYDQRKSADEARARCLRAELSDAEKRSSVVRVDLDFAFASLDAHWDSFEPVDHREAIGSVIAGIVISPGRGKIELPARVQVFEGWRSAEFSSWLEARRKTAA